MDAIREREEWERMMGKRKREEEKQKDAGKERTGRNGRDTKRSRMKMKNDKKNGCNKGTRGMGEERWVEEPEEDGKKKGRSKMRGKRERDERMRVE